MPRNKKNKGGGGQSAPKSSNNQPKVGENTVIPLPPPPEDPETIKVRLAEAKLRLSQVEAVIETIGVQRQSTDAVIEVAAQKLHSLDQSADNKAEPGAAEEPQTTESNTGTAKKNKKHNKNKMHNLNPPEGAPAASALKVAPAPQPCPVKQAPASDLIEMAKTDDPTVVAEDTEMKNQPSKNKKKNKNKNKQPPPTELATANTASPTVHAGPSDVVASEKPVAVKPAAEIIETEVKDLKTEEAAEAIIQSKEGTPAADGKKKKNKNKNKNKTKEEHVEQTETEKPVHQEPTPKPDIKAGFSVTEAVLPQKLEEIATKNAEVESKSASVSGEKEHKIPAETLTETNPPNKAVQSQDITIPTGKPNKKNKNKNKNNLAIDETLEEHAELEDSATTLIATIQLPSSKEKNPPSQIESGAAITVDAKLAKCGEISKEITLESPKKAQSIELPKPADEPRPIEVAASVSETNQGPPLTETPADQAAAKEEDVKKGAEMIWKILDPPTNVAVIEGNVKHKKGHKKETQIQEENTPMKENASILATFDLPKEDNKKENQVGKEANSKERKPEPNKEPKAKETEKDTKLVKHDLKTDEALTQHKPTENEKQDTKEATKELEKQLLSASLTKLIDTVPKRPSADITTEKIKDDKTTISIQPIAAVVLKDETKLEVDQNTQTTANKESVDNKLKTESKKPDNIKSAPKLEDKQIESKKDVLPAPTQTQADSIPQIKSVVTNVGTEIEPIQGLACKENEVKPLEPAKKTEDDKKKPPKTSQKSEDQSEKKKTPVTPETKKEPKKPAPPSVKGESTSSETKKESVCVASPKVEVKKEAPPKKTTDKSEKKEDTSIKDSPKKIYETKSDEIKSVVTPGPIEPKIPENKAPKSNESSSTVAGDLKPDTNAPKTKELPIVVSSENKTAEAKPEKLNSPKIKSETATSTAKSTLETSTKKDDKKDAKPKQTKVKSKAPQPPRTDDSPAPSETSSSSASTIVEVPQNESLPILSDPKNVQRSVSVQSADAAAVADPKTDSLPGNEKFTEIVASSNHDTVRESKAASPTTNKRNKNDANLKQSAECAETKTHQELPEKTSQEKSDQVQVSDVQLMDILEPKMSAGTKAGAVSGNVRVKAANTATKTKLEGNTTKDTATKEKLEVKTTKDTTTKEKPEGKTTAKDTGAIPKTATVKEKKVPVNAPATATATKKQSSPRPEVNNNKPKTDLKTSAANKESPPKTVTMTKNDTPPKADTPTKIIKKSSSPPKILPAAATTPKAAVNNKSPILNNKAATPTAKPAIPPRPNNLVSSPAQTKKSTTNSASSSNASTPSPNMYDDEDYVEYKFAPRPVFMSTICQVCKIPLQSFVHCKQCMMISYCTVEHLQEDEVGHKPLCAAIQEIAKKRGGHIYNNARILNDDDYRSLRVHTLNLCENTLKRHLQPYEREILLFPRLCSTGSCREWRQHLLTECKSCGQVSYCTANPDHLAGTHAKWCQAFSLYQKLVVTQKHYGRIEPSLPSKLMSKQYQLTPNIDETFRNLYKNYGAIKDECTYAALTQLATAPLTAYYGIQLASQPMGDRFTIHLIGAELQFEADTLDKWEMFFLHLVPQLVELRVVFVGPELNAENLPLEILSRIRMCRACRQNCRAVKFDFQCGTLYHNYVKSKAFTKPDLICFFNPGLYRATGFNGQDTWPETIKSATSLDAPVVVTSYTEVEAPRDLDRLQRESGREMVTLQAPHINPFTSQRPERNFISDEVAPMIFKNFYCFVCK